MKILEDQTDERMKALEKAHKEMEDMVVGGRCLEDGGVERYRRLLVVGLSETEDMVHDSITATNDDDKVKLLLAAMGTAHIKVNVCVDVGVSDYDSLYYNL